MSNSGLLEMKKNYLISLIAIGLSSLSITGWAKVGFVSVDSYLQAQATQLAPENWQNLSFETDGVAGTGVEQVYANWPDIDHEVIVAVIDTGVDVNHEDLQGKIWINRDEIPGNNLDDDGNGYIDDYVGWNFIGSPTGMGKVQEGANNANGFIFYPGDPNQQLRCDDKASTRELRLLMKLEQTESLTENQKKKLQELKEDIIPKREQALNYLNKYQEYYAEFMHQIGILKGLGLKEVSSQAVANLEIDPSKIELLKIQASVYEKLNNGITPERLEKSIAENREEAYCFYNYVEDPRIAIVGDNPSDLSEKGYGNNDVIGPNPDHGTSVAGIIAANRENDVGIKGIVRNAKIMPLRVLSKGDERDKDVANAILYAVENGARIINISFGKYSSLNKEVVDHAIAYAEQKDVLIVNSAGNDGFDNDTTIYYPNDLSTNGKRFSNMITVGASGAKVGNSLVPRFTNYGQSSVDLLAPGVMIQSLATGNKYFYSSGTSLSAPIVSGIAALLVTLKPDLKPRQIKDYLMQTTSHFPGKIIYGRQPMYLTDFCRTGGIVNAYAAVQALLATPATNSLASY